MRLEESAKESVLRSALTLDLKQDIVDQDGFVFAGFLAAGRAGEDAIIGDGFAPPPTSLHCRFDAFDADGPCARVETAGDAHSLALERLHVRRIIEMINPAIGFEQEKLFAVAQHRAFELGGVRLLRVRSGNGRRNVGEKWTSPCQRAHKDKGADNKAQQ